jgi:hypothetical protein
MDYNNAIFKDLDSMGVTTKFPRLIIEPPNIEPSNNDQINTDPIPAKKPRKSKKQPLMKADKNNNPVKAPKPPKLPKEPKQPTSTTAKPFLTYAQKMKQWREAKERRLKAEQEQAQQTLLTTPITQVEQIDLVLQIVQSEQTKQTEQSPKIIEKDIFKSSLQLTTLKTPQITELLPEIAEIISSQKAMHNLTIDYIKNTPPAHNQTIENYYWFYTTYMSGFNNNGAIVSARDFTLLTKAYGYEFDKYSYSYKWMLYLSRNKLLNAGDYDKIPYSKSLDELDVFITGLPRFELAQMEVETIYLVTDGKYVKIGRTQQEFEERLKELQTGNAYTLSKLAIFTAPVILNIENRVHHVLCAKSRAREWFNLTPDDIEAIAVILSKLEVQVTPISLPPYPRMVI